MTAMETAVPRDAEVPCIAHRNTPDDIFGWFDFADLYNRTVEEAPPGAILVEVGVFLGKSLVHLAEKARDANKGLRVFGVDTWRGSPEFDGAVWFNGQPANAVPEELLASCYKTLIARGLADHVTLIVSDSAKAASIFADKSVYFVFLDAGHSEVNVKADIAAWQAKIAAGGTMAGHDYPDRDFPGVKRAVDAAFGNRVNAQGSCWEVWL